jgi:hypothetical protein
MHAGSWEKVVMDDGQEESPNENENVPELLDGHELITMDTEFAEQE